MYRTLLDLPSLGLLVRSADAFVLLAIGTVLFIGPRWAAALEGVDRRAVRRSLLVLAVITLVGGRLHFMLNYPHAFAGRPLAVLKLWTGGLHIPGGILALALAAPWVTRWFGLSSAGRFGDGIAPAMGLGIAIARMGCFLQGCCFGTVCDHFWCLAFPEGSLPFVVHQSDGLLPAGAQWSLPVHPLQLYYVASGLAITAVALWLRPRKRYDGQVALVALLMFSLVSVAGLEFLRADAQPRVYWGALPQLAWTGLAMGAATAVALLLIGRRHRAAPPLPAAVPSGNELPQRLS
ncbi:MAG TPA: prolipoprotein diacylglyceryl transferase family protein [Candidatus Dormibacteraeota bacterium]|nr:prolipoprotein diacylglyceryl transferase family protein [Candidatus Dormibacteraeota bacterium]